MRLLPLATALTLAVAMGVAPAQESRLPDIGSSAGELLTPARQAEYGKMMLAELRNYDYVLDDPLVTDWLQTMGTRLGANSDQPQQPFTFFMLRDRQINAFATLGGYIAVNAGLVLTAEREDEVAAVLSHEIAHVTQQHVLRGWSGRSAIRSRSCSACWRRWWPRNRPAAIPRATPPWPASPAPWG